MYKFGDISSAPIFTANGYKIFPLHDSVYYIKNNCCYRQPISSLKVGNPPTQFEVITKPTKVSDFVTKYESFPKNTHLHAYDNLKTFDSFEKLLEYQKSQNHNKEYNPN